MNVRRLPRGTVRAEEEHDQRCVGVVLTEAAEALYGEVLSGSIALLRLADDAKTDTGEKKPLDLSELVVSFDEATVDDPTPEGDTEGQTPATRNLVRGDLVEFTLFTSLVKRSIKRASRLSLLAAPALPSGRGTVSEISGEVGWIQPAPGPDAQTEAEATTALVPFSTRQAADQVRAGDEVQFLLAPPEADATVAAAADSPELAAPLLDSTRAVGVAFVLGGSRGGTPKIRVKRQLNVAKVQYREAKGPDGTLGFPEGWRCGEAGVGAPFENPGE